MKKLNKKIPISVGVAVIIISAVVIFAGVYFFQKKLPIKTIQSTSIATSTSENDNTPIDTSNESQDYNNNYAFDKSYNYKDVVLGETGTSSLLLKKLISLDPDKNTTDYSIATTTKAHTLSVRESRVVDDGGAHPNHPEYTFVYDLLTGKEIELKQLFGQNKNYLTVLSSLSRKLLPYVLEKPFYDLDSIESGTGPSIESFNKFMITDQGLVIVFSEYQVAAYVAGASRVIIPWVELKEVLDPYWSSLLLNNKETPIPTFSTSTISYKMVPAIDSRYSYPQIINYPNKEMMDKVNNTLKEFFKDFGCDPESVSFAKENGMDKYISWNMKISVDYARNDIFSVNEKGNYYCGGAYPTNDASYTYTFDMKTGEGVSFVRLFKNYDVNHSKIISTIYSDVIASTSDYISKHPDVKNQCEVENTLENLDVGNGKFGLQDYRILSPKSITVRPEYPHATEACIESVEVPIQKLLPFIDNNSILKRI